MPSPDPCVCGKCDFSMEERIWTTGSKEKIAYCQLGNRHLRNIIRYLEGVEESGLPFGDPDDHDDPQRHPLDQGDDTSRLIEELTIEQDRREVDGPTPPIPRGF